MTDWKYDVQSLFGHVLPCHPLPTLPLQLSAGDMLRQAVKDQTEVGMKAKGFMDEVCISCAYHINEIGVTYQESRVGSNVTTRPERTH